MAQRPPRFCVTPGCNGRTRSRYCDRCEAEAQARKREADTARGSNAARGYDAAWRRLRKKKLSLSPWCECDECKASGAKVLADVVDHEHPISTHPHLRLVLGNLRSMAKAHHDRHTARTQGFARPKGDATA